MVEVHIRHGQASSKTSWSLTEEGRIQAEAAADYLRANFPHFSPLGVHSGSRRAVETAQILGLADLEWSKDERLREADWKGAPEPSSFEPWAEMYTRVAAACESWDAQGGDLVVVTHGGTMRMVRAYREDLSGERFQSLFNEPYKYFNNCQMIIYSNENPANQSVELEKLWVKSVCPWDMGRFGHDWMQIAT